MALLTTTPLTATRRFSQVRALGFALSLVCAGGALADPVNINTADAASMAASLNGVGPKLAESIIRYRQQHGPFESAQDLAKVSGIGSKVVERNRDNILLRDPPGAKAKK